MNHISTPTLYPAHANSTDFNRTDRGVEPHGMCRCDRPHPNRMVNTGMFSRFHQCGRCHRPIWGTP